MIFHFLTIFFKDLIGLLELCGIALPNAPISRYPISRCPITQVHVYIKATNKSNSPIMSQLAGTQLKNYPGKKLSNSMPQLAGTRNGFKKVPKILA